MYCKKCGFQIPDGKSVCPFCGTNNNETPNQVNKEYKPVDENTMAELRNSFGYIDLKTQFFHHILIAAGGYLLMYVLMLVASTIAIAIYSNKYDFSCMNENAQACSIAVKNVYTKISSIGQVVAELLVVAILVIIFRKHLKTFFKEAKDKVTWKYFGIGLAIMYGGNMVYNMLITILGLSSTSSNQNAVNEVIFGAPLLGFLFVVLAAPLFEEIIFRFGIFRSFTFKNKKLEKIGVFLTALIFASVHMVATFQTVAKGPVCMVELSGEIYENAEKSYLIDNNLDHKIIVYDKDMNVLKEVNVKADTNDFKNGTSISLANYKYHKGDKLYLSIDGKMIEEKIGVTNIESPVPTYYYNYSAYDVLSSDLLSFPTYLIGAFALTYACYKSKNLITSILMHMTYNGLSFFLIILMGI